MLRLFYGLAFGKGFFEGKGSFNPDYALEKFLCFVLRHALRQIADHYANAESGFKQLSKIEIGLVI